MPSQSQPKGAESMPSIPHAQTSPPADEFDDGPEPIVDDVGGGIHQQLQWLIQFVEDEIWEEPHQSARPENKEHPVAMHPNAQIPQWRARRPCTGDSP